MFCILTDRPTEVVNYSLCSNISSKIPMTLKYMSANKERNNELGLKINTKKEGMTEIKSPLALLILILIKILIFS